MRLNILVLDRVPVHKRLVISPCFDVLVAKVVLRSSFYGCCLLEYIEYVSMPNLFNNISFLFIILY